MNPLGYHCILIANNWRSLGDRFSGDNLKFQSNDFWAFLGIVALATILIGGLFWLQRRHQRREKSNKPIHLFHDLCTVHELTHRERKWLQQLAAAHDLHNPTLLFVRPDLFSTQGLPKSLEKQVEKLEGLRDRLFAGLDDFEPDETNSHDQPAGDVPNPPASAVPIVLPTAGDAPTVDLPNATS